MYRWLEHTSEAELWVEDETPEAVLGQRTTPQTLVKAVTHHRLELGHEPGSPWNARVVLGV